MTAVLGVVRYDHAEGQRMGFVFMVVVVLVCVGIQLPCTLLVSSGPEAVAGGCRRLVWRPVQQNAVVGAKEWWHLARYLQ